MLISGGSQGYTGSQSWDRGREMAQCGGVDGGWAGGGLAGAGHLLSHSPDQDEIEIPEITDLSRRQLVRTSKRRFSFRISNEERQQQRK